MVKNYTEVRGESTAPGSVLSPETLERLRALQERALQAAMVGAGREAVAERIVDEMARRQGHRLGPFFDWSRVTEDFRLRFDAAFSAKPPQQEVAEFVRLFVNAWPPGMFALRLNPLNADRFSQPPFSRDGLWPAYLADPP